MTTEIQEYSKTEAALSALREQFGGMTYDVDSADGMKNAKDARAEVRGYRTSLEKMRKALKAPALERSRLIDAEAKRITTELVAIEAPIDGQIKREEARKETERQEKIEAETRRVEDIQERIRELRGAIDVVTRYNSKASLIADHIGDLESIAIDDSFDEFREQAQDAKYATLARLSDIHAATVERETEAARIQAEREELEQLRKDAEKREAAQQARREKKEAAALEKREAAEQKQRDELEAQRKKQAEEQARIDAERAALEQEQREAAEEQAAAERVGRERQAAIEAAAKKSKYPGDGEIINVLSKHFGVPTDVAIGWLTQFRSAA